VSRADAEALYAIVERACVAIAARDPAEVWAALKKLDVPVDTAFEANSGAERWVLPKEAFPKRTDFERELRQRSARARVAAFPLLADLDPSAAVPLFVEAARLDLTNSIVGTLEAELSRSVWARWKALDVPPSLFAELFLAGRFSMEALSDAQLAAIPFDALADAIVGDNLPYPGHEDAQRLVRVRPELANLERAGALAERLAEVDGNFARELLPWLLEVLFRAKHPSGERAALKFAEREGPTPQAVAFVIAARHVPTLERWFGTLQCRRLKWDPHHLDLEYAPAIRAGYALDPASASVRFRPFFESKAVRSDAGAKLAHDIWLVGQGTLVDHRGTRLVTGSGDLLSADPRWAEIARPLAKHRRLGPMARRVSRRAAASR